MTDDDPEDDRPSWDEHAEDLEGAQLALAMTRAYLDRSPTGDESLSVITSRIEEQLEAGDFSTAVSLEGQLVLLVIEFGRKVHGRYLDAVLAEMQRELADHVARYNPDVHHGEDRESS
jgi:hypothetical protein